MLAIAATPAWGTMVNPSGNLDGSKHVHGRRSLGSLAEAVSGRRSETLGFCGSLGAVRCNTVLNNGANMCRGALRPLPLAVGQGHGRKGGRGAIKATFVIDEDSATPTISPVSNGGIFTATSHQTILTNCDSTMVTPSALPYFGSEPEQIVGMDSVLNGIKVGHCISSSRHPKLPFSEQPALNSVVQKLHDVGMTAVSAPAGNAALDLTFGQIQKVRDEVERGHSASERKLSALGHLLVERFVGTNSYQITSMVTAQSNKNVFTLSENIPLETIDEGADSAQLARDQLEGLSVDGEHVTMSDHSIEFGANVWNDWGVHRVIAHARPARDLWKVIADSLFGLEHPQVDRFVDDDMYHIKLVVEDDEHADRVHRSLRNMEYTDEELRARGIPSEASTRKLHLVCESTHTAEALGHRVWHSQDTAKTLGDRCSTVKFWGMGIQIRVQTLNEHYAEAEMITMTNREQLAQRKEQQHEHLAAQSPVYGFARNLLRWMLDEDATTLPPSSGSIQVTVHH